MSWDADLPLLAEGVDGPGDWGDVVLRAGRMTRRVRRRRAALTLATLALAGLLVAPAFGVGGWYDALFGRAAPAPLVVQRTNGSCRLEQDGRTVATIRCPGPALAEPLDDFSVYARGRRVVRLAGAAAPPIAAVALLTPSGSLVARTAVSDGFYARTDDLPDGRVEAVVGLDASGRPVACAPAAAPLCPAHGGDRR